MGKANKQTLKSKILVGTAAAIIGMASFYGSVKCLSNACKSDLIPFTEETQSIKTVRNLENKLIKESLVETFRNHKEKEFLSLIKNIESAYSQIDPNEVINFFHAPTK